MYVSIVGIHHWKCTFNKYFRFLNEMQRKSITNYGCLAYDFMIFSIKLQCIAIKTIHLSHNSIVPMSFVCVRDLNIQTIDHVYQITFFLQRQHFDRNALNFRSKFTSIQKIQPCPKSNLHFSICHIRISN